MRTLSRPLSLAVVLLTLLFIWCACVYCSEVDVNTERSNSHEEEISAKEFKHLLNRALIKACKDMRKGIKHVKTICKLKESHTKKRSAASDESSMDLSDIKGGYGYSIIDHAVKLPVLASGRAKVLETPSIETSDNHFKSPRSFFSHVYNMNSSVLTPILFSNTLESAKQTFHKLFESKTDVHSITSKYCFYSVKSNKNLIFSDIFEPIYRRLPKRYNASIYNLVIAMFGERVMIQVFYGGLVGQTSIIRSCYSDEHAIRYAGLNFQNYLQGCNNTENTDIPATFLKYSKIASIDILGGNPQISKVHNRISTFARNPAPIKFRTVPIWEVMPQGSYQRKNLQIAYEKYMEKAILKKERKIAAIENLKIKQSSKPLQLKIFLQQSPCGLQDYSKYICRAGNNGLHCFSGRSRPACTGLINKREDRLLRRSNTPKLIFSKCVDQFLLMGVAECLYKAQLRLYVIRNEDDEVQLEMKYAYSVYDNNYETFSVEEETIFTSEKQKAGGCLVVNSKHFSRKIPGVEGIKWMVCFNCQPQIGKDHYTFECKCPYLLQ